VKQALKMLHLGLTGSIGSGKSTVATLLRQRSIPVLDADQTAKAVSSQKDVLFEVATTFGQEYVLDGSLNRPKLAELVFAQPEARAKLNAIVHPKVRQAMAAQVAALQAAGETEVVVQDIPLLFENGLEHLFDAVLLVDASLDLRMARVMARDGSSREQFLARDSAQMPASEKRRRTPYVLENDGDVGALEQQLERVLAGLLELHRKNLLSFYQRP
jgi:dephospho-CoA kinase